MRIAIDLDVLGDTRPLWHAWLEDVSRVLDVSGLPEDRTAAAAELDARGAGNWRVLLERFADDRAPVYLRPAAEVSAALRGIQADGTEIVVFTDAPARARTRRPASARGRPAGRRARALAAARGRRRQDAGGAAPPA